MHPPICECIRHNQGATLKTNWSLFAIWTAAIIAASAILAAVIVTSSTPGSMSGVGWIAAPIVQFSQELHPFAIFGGIALLGMAILGLFFWANSLRRRAQSR